MAHEPFPSYPTLADAIEDAERVTVRWSYDNVRHLSAGQVAAIVEALRAVPSETRRLYKAEEWHEDMGDVLWWRLPVEEPPYVGSPLDMDWRSDPYGTAPYYTHFEKLPEAPRG